jgi:dihydroorotate dehydrogenase electron transfer subunit
MSRKLLPGLPTTVPVTKVELDNERMVTITLDARIDMEPGQFVMLWIPGVDEKPFSVLKPEPLTISIACIGPFTNKIRTLKPGDKLGYRGPYGKGFKITGNKVLIVGGGCGLASVAHLATVCSGQGIETHVVAAFKTKAESFHLATLEKAGCIMHPCTDDGSLGYKGYASAQVAELLKTNSFNQVYACGPEMMLVTTRTVLDEAQVPDQFSLERYMKCGIGICDQCSMNGKLVCQDGPVFDQKQIVKLTELGKFRRLVTGEKVPAIGAPSC